MFCALKGATDRPRFLSQAQMAVAIQLLPAFDDVPPTNSDRALIRDRPSGPSARVVSSCTQHCTARVRHPATIGQLAHSSPCCRRYHRQQLATR